MPVVRHQLSGVDLTRLDGFKSEPINFEREKKTMWPDTVKREVLTVLCYEKNTLYSCRTHVSFIIYKKKMVNS